MFRKARQETPAGGDEALFQALGKSKRAKRRRVLRTVIIVVCILAAGATGGVIYLRRQVREQFASTGQEVLSAAAERGSISTVVSGSGTLMNVDTETSAPPSRSTGISIPAWWAADSWRARRRWPWSSRRR